MKKALVILFDKVEEIEAVCPIDILRRGGVSVTTASIGKSDCVVGRSSVKLYADTLFGTVAEADFDAVVVPGGPGTFDLLDNTDLLSCISRHFRAGKIVAAICAAPLVLKNAGILDGIRCTAHTSVIGKLENSDSTLPVVCNKNVVTSQGAGTAVQFALSILSLLTSQKNTNDVAKSICFLK